MTTKLTKNQKNILSERMRATACAILSRVRPHAKIIMYKILIDADGIPATIIALMSPSVEASDLSADPQTELAKWPDEKRIVVLRAGDFKSDDHLEVAYTTKQSVALNDKTLEIEAVVSAYPSELGPVTDMYMDIYSYLVFGIHPSTT